MRVAIALLFCGYLDLLGAGVRESVHGYRVVQRNFYGLLKVDQEGEPSDEDGYRRLTHGVINHGEQMLHKALTLDPENDDGTAYMNSVRGQPDRSRRAHP